MGLGYCDLNVRARNPKEARAMCLAAVEGYFPLLINAHVLIFYFCILAGFRLVAINTEVEADILAKRNKKEAARSLPSPMDLTALQKVGFKCTHVVINTMTINIF
jgi:hypothetical protein